MANSEQEFTTEEQSEVELGVNMVGGCLLWAEIGVEIEAKSKSRSINNVIIFTQVIKSRVSLTRSEIWDRYCSMFPIVSTINKPSDADMEQFKPKQKGHTFSLFSLYCIKSSRYLL